MWTDLWAGLALMLVFEGMLPFLNPAAWRKMALVAAAQNDGRLRRWGLLAMLLGVIVLSWVREGF